MFKADIQAYIEYLGMSIGYIPKKLSIYGMGIGYIPISYPIPNKKVFQNFKCFKKKNTKKNEKTRHDHGMITVRSRIGHTRTRPGLKVVISTALNRIYLKKI